MTRCKLANLLLSLACDHPDACNQAMAYRYCRATLYYGGAGSSLQAEERRALALAAAVPLYWT